MLISLRNYDLFKSISDHDCDEIVSNSYLSTYFKGEVIHFEEDYCKNLELVVSGKIHIEQIEDNGNTLVLKEYESGDWIGSNLLFASDNMYMLFVMADVNSKILSIPKTYVENCLTNVEFRKEFIKMISDNTLYFGKRIKADYRQTLRQKIIKHVKKEAVAQNKMKIILNSSKTILARQFGVARTSLSRELQKMRKNGMIEYDRNSITILNI